MTLLGSLPQSYSTLVTALEAHVGDIKLDFVQQALTHEEQKIKQSNAVLPGGQEDAALMGRLRKPFKFQNPRCFYCKQLGHFRRDCPKRRQQDNDKAMHKAKAAEEKLPEKQHVNIDFESPDEGVFAASVGSASQVGKWLVDSGASRHMTSKREILTHYSEFEKPEKVGLGDGRTVNAVAIGEGNVYVNMQLEKCRPKESMIAECLSIRHNYNREGPAAVGLLSRSAYIYIFVYLYIYYIYICPRLR